jgi:hypothetical protein
MYRLRRSIWLAAVCLGLECVGRVAAQDGNVSDYKITSVMQMIGQSCVQSLNDEFQSTQVVTCDAQSTTLKIIYHPFAKQRIEANQLWRLENRGMVRFLAPTPSENWDQTMKKDLEIELQKQGYDLDRINDVDLVQAVSNLALSRAHRQRRFAIWSVYFPAGKPEVFPALRENFDEQKPDIGWSDLQIFRQEVLGREMFYSRRYGSCTSFAVYLATLLRSLGIPSRFVAFVPPYDPNDPQQAALFAAKVHNPIVREIVETNLRREHGFIDHIFLEVFVGHHWDRLNYNKLGQTILDRNYLGLMTHVKTFNSYSTSSICETWGMRYYRYPAGQAKLSSVNPYRLLSISDNADKD